VADLVERWFAELTNRKLRRSAHRSIRQLTDDLYPGGGPAQYATIQKQLERLESKGFVKRDRSLFVHVFSAAVDRDELIGRRLRAVADKLCGGSLVPILSHLARSKGLSEPRVVLGHALRNSLITVVTLVGVYIPILLSSAVIVETVFAWPGVGRYLVLGVQGRDFPVVQATVLLIAIGFVVCNLITDLLLVYIDPRIRFE
jgi:predicted transcriptional regulator